MKKHRAHWALGIALCLSLLGGCLDFGKAPGGTEGEGLTGIILTPQGTPAANVKVFLYPVETGPAKRSDGAHFDSAFTNARGKFSFKNSSAATYNVAVSFKRGDTLFAVFVRDVEYPGGNYDLGTRGLIRTGGIKIHLLDASGPVDNLECSIPASPFVGTAVADSNQCVVKGVPPGTYEVVVSAPGFQTTVIPSIIVVSGQHTPGTTDLVPVDAPPKPAGQYFETRPSTIALWTFNAQADSFFQDVSGNNRHIKAPAGATLESSPNGKSVTFTQGHVSSADSSLKFVNLSAITVETRIRMTEYPSSSLFNRCAHLIGSYGVLSLYIGDDGRLQVSAQVGTGSTWNWHGGETPKGTVPLNEWVDIAMAADQTTGRVYAYLNGKPIQLYNPAAAALGTQLRTDAGYPFNIGGLDINNQRFSGRIEEVRVSRGLVLGSGPAVLVAPNTNWTATRVAPAAPTLKSPTSGATVSSTVTLTWDSVSQAGTYHVEVARDSNFAQLLLVDSLLLGTTRAFTNVEVGSTYYWRVRAKNSAGAGNFSAVRRFLGGTSSLSKISLISVADANVAGPMPGYPDNNGLLVRNGGTVGTISSGAFDVYGGGRALVRFAIPSGYTAANINNAVLRLNVKNWEVRNVHATYRLDVHRLLKSWKEGAGTDVDQINSPTIDGITGLERFWGTQNGSEDWSEQLVGIKDNDAASAVSATLSKPTGSMETWSFDITALAKVWAADSTANFGVILVTGIPATNADVFDYPVFYSKEAAVADSLKPTLILNGP